MINRRALTQYIVGFVGSVLLTLVAFYIVSSGVLTGWTAVFYIIGLAVIQCMIQLFFFLHITEDGRPRWKLQSFLFMLFALAIVVAGSLWVMASLNDRMMPTSQEMQQYMHRQSITGL